jgi:hypothetical protein
MGVAIAPRRAFSGLKNREYPGAVEIFRPKTARWIRFGPGSVLRRWRPDVAGASSATCAAPACAMVFRGSLVPKQEPDLEHLTRIVLEIPA